MDYIIENLKTLYAVSGWSYETLANKLNEGVPEIERFSKDQIRSYEKGFSGPKLHFKNVLAGFLGVEVGDIIKRKLTPDEISEKLKPDSQSEVELLRKRVKDLEKIIALQEKLLEKETLPPLKSAENAG